MTTFTATTPEQARLLHDRHYSSLLGHLIRAELSAAQLAKLTGLDVKAAHHRLTRLHQADLALVSAEQRRAGRPVKIYRASAQEFHVPFHLTSAATFADLLVELQRNHLHTHYAVMGEQVMRHSQGTFSYLPSAGGSLLGTVKDLVTTENTGEEVGHSTYYRHRLTPEQAREAERRLTELTQWLEEKSEANGKEGTPYTLGLLLSPESLS